MRCLALAEAMRRDGAECLFVCGAETPETVPALAASGFPARLVDAAGDPAAWIGDFGADAFDIAVVDSYALDALFETLLRGTAPTIVAIDDLADRPHDCDILLDQTFGRRASDYCGLLPAGATVLCGPDYALLRPEFMALRQASLDRRRSQPAVGRILVALGMTDVGSVTREVVGVLLDAAVDAHLDVAVGQGAPSLEALKRMAPASGRVTLHVATPRMAELMAQADLAIGAAGTSSWERCCLGLPTLMLTLADNQRLVAEQLAVAGACRRVRRDQVALLPAMIEDLGRDPGALARMIECAAAVCDGGGVPRVLAAVAARGRPEPVQSGWPVDVRPADQRDRVDVWLWRNQTTTRAHSLSSDDIPFADHAAWWTNREQPGRLLLIAVTKGGRSVGQIRFDRITEEGGTPASVVSIGLAPEFLGRGYGRRCLAEAIAHRERSCGREALLADIHRENVASTRIFEQCGFVFSGEHAQFVRYRRD